MLQIDSMSHEGNSGGPLIQVTSGLIVGMITSRFNPQQGGAQIVTGGRVLGAETSLSYAVAETHLREVLQAEGIDVT